jgi:hypothetical protein
VAKFACQMPHPYRKIDGFVEFAILNLLLQLLVAMLLNGLFLNLYFLLTPA